MKIIGNDGKEYTGETTEEAIAKAREADNALQERLEQEKLEQEKANIQMATAKDKAISKDKKELSNKIESTETELNNAYKEYQDALVQVRNLNAEHDQKVKAILGDVENKLATAKQAHYQAVRDFNHKYGAYRKVYTGEEAKEREKLIRDMFNAFDTNWKDWFKDFFDFYW